VPGDYLTRFKQILSTLPDDKKKALYAKLKGLSADSRNDFIKEFVISYDNRHKKQPEVKAEPKAKPEQTPQKSEPKVKAKPKTKPEPKKADLPKNEMGQQGTYVILAAVSIICVAILIAVAIKNRQGIADLARAVGGESQISSEESAVISGDESRAAQAALAIQASASSEETTPPATPTPTPVPLAEDAPDLTGLVVVLDPGHQAETDYGMELLDPDTTITKLRCTSGATGVAANVKEYELTLQIALITKSYLEGCGASVVITRDTNDVYLSNQERANLAIASSPDVFIRIHCDGAPDSSISGVRVYVPESGSYTNSSIRMADTLGQLVADSRGTEYLGSVATGLYTGLNYADSIRSFQLVCGYISNSEDEKALTEEDTQYAIADAIARFCDTIK